jgi:MFS transporter, BCD family, chlorophyll transporter
MEQTPGWLIAVRALQLTLPRAAAGWLFALLTSNFNRIAIYELGIAAVVVTTLLGLYHFLSPFEVVYGRLADRVPIMGRHRSPYVFIGMMLAACAVAVLPAVVVPMSIDPHQFHSFSFPYASYLAGFGVLTLFGIGFAMAGSNHLALVAEVIPERSRGLVTALIWTAMIIGMIGSLAFIRSYMPDYDHERMQSLYLLSIPVVGVAVFFGLLGVEPHSDKRSDAVRNSSKESHASLKAFAIGMARDSAARNFFLYLFLFMFGYSLQNNIIEVFGAQVLGMSVGETGRFQQIWGTGAIFGMFGMGLMVFRGGMNKRTAITIGITGIGGALFLLGYGSLQANATIVDIALVIMGFSNGLALVGTLTSMMEFSTDAERGAYIGIWGMSIAIASGVSSIASGQLVTGLIESGMLAPDVGFANIFVLEGFITLASLLFLWRVKHHCFDAAPASPVLSPLMEKS